MMWGKRKNPKYFHGFPKYFHGFHHGFHWISTSQANSKPIPPEKGWEGLRTWAVPTRALCSRWSCWDALFQKMLCLMMFVVFWQNCTLLDNVVQWMCNNVQWMYNVIQFFNCPVWATATAAHRPCGSTSLSHCSLFWLCWLGQLDGNLCPDPERQPSSPEITWLFSVAAMTLWLGSLAASGN